MFERDLTLPDEGAMCIDSNIHAAKYLMVQLMNRINKDMNTWWKYNIATDRKGKLANWENGFRPDLTGKNYPVKEIDPITGEPKAPVRIGVHSTAPIDQDLRKAVERWW